MASISPSPTFPATLRSDQNPHRLLFNPTVSISPPPPRHKRPSQSLSRSPSDSTTTACRCSSSGKTSGESSGGWDSAISNALKWFHGVLSAYASNQVERMEVSGGGGGGGEREVMSDGGEGDWDWERWKEHFDEVDEQERMVLFLKLQLTRAALREDYEEAARLKVAIAAAAANDTVGRVMFNLSKAIKDERYQDAAFVRDHAGAGLVGWWAGLSNNNNDPYGHIIRINAEHGRYVAKTFSPSQLAAATDGTPLFEVFLTRNKKGEYKQQAVYLKKSELPQDSGLTGILDDLWGGNLSAKAGEDTEDGEGSDDEGSDGESSDGDSSDDESDITEESVFENVPQDMIPGVNDPKVKVFNISSSGKIDRDLISKVVEQMMEEDDDEMNADLESLDEEDDKGEDDDDQFDTEMHPKFDELERKAGILFNIGFADKFFGSRSGTSLKDYNRVPASVEKKDRFSFSFSLKQDDQRVTGEDSQSLSKQPAKLRGNRSIDNLMLTLEKDSVKNLITMEARRDLRQLLNFVSRARNPQPLSGSTTFNRIEFPASPDPLNALYVGAHGFFSSEVIHLRRRFGQWQEDGRKNQLPDLEFYEYVEALKLTGDAHVPAGQVAFRAKIGKRYQLPHKGIIPEELGVVARYRGQGRLAEPGFKNPRWVDGDLVILDGKIIKGGPAVGFVYWDPEYHFLLFFNQLRLQN